jgi:hypothetical protein
MHFVAKAHDRTRGVGCPFPEGFADPLGRAAFDLVAIPADELDEEFVDWSCH